jgi:hypothetical protein
VKIAKVQVAVSFDTDKQIVLNCAAGIKKLQKIIGGRFIQLNVPDFAPPNTPRALIKSPDTLINLASDRFDIITTPPKHVVGDVAACLEFALSRSQQVLGAIYAESLGYHWVGVLTTVQFPGNKESKSGVADVTPVYERLVGINKNNRSLATFRLQIGYKEQDFFRTYTISGYETLEVSIRAQSIPKEVVVNLEEIPAIESGIQVLVDVNNRPSVKKLGVQADLDASINQMLGTLKTLARDLNLEGIIT